MIKTLSELVLSAPELSSARMPLEQFRARSLAALPDSFKVDIDAVREAAVRVNDDLLAKAAWCLETIGEAQDKFVSAFRHARQTEFYAAWCALERCEISLGFLRRHFPGGKDRFGVDHMCEHVPRFQGLFPYRLFASPAYVKDETRCSICDSVIGLRNGCDHETGEIYSGQMCCRVISKSTLLEISLVENPAQKYSVAFPKDVSYNYGVVSYLVRGLASPWDAWSYSKTLIETGKPLVRGAGRNDSCPCRSGLKFKRCCLGKKLTREHFQIEFEVPPPADLPCYMEGLYGAPPPAEIVDGIE